MQLDFHYYCVKSLALEAGLSKANAELVAYASQFTDDNSDRLPLTIREMPALAAPLLDKQGRLLPVTSMHWLDEYWLGAKNRCMHHDVLVSFHFLPPEPSKNGADFDYRVEPDGMWAQELLREAVAKVRQTPDQASLIALGLMLHTYADTWSHQRFAGILSDAHNDLKSISVFKEGRWQSRKVPNIMPNLGHGEALHYPDIPSMHWKYVLESDPTEIERDNHPIFLEAAEKVYGALCQAVDGTNRWASVKDRVSRCLATPHGSRKQAAATWSSAFGVKLSYDPKEWKAAALDSDLPDPNNLNSDEYIYTFTFRGDTRWFDFQLAAMAQRQRVRKGLPQIA